MKSFFAIVLDGQVIRTGRCPTNMVELQAVELGSGAVIIDDDYMPGDLMFDGGVVKRRSDGASVQVPA